MRALRAWLLRLCDPLRRRARERDLQDELAAHLQLHVDDNVRRGLSPGEARRLALLELGGVEPTKERYRERRGLPLIDSLMQDVRHALRLTWSHRGFSAVAMLTLALGVGSVAVIYSVVRQVLLDPFPYVHSDRMVDVIVRDSATGRMARGPLPTPEFLDFQEQSTVFEEVLGTKVEGMHYVGEAGADRLQVGWVTPNMFSFLGVAPLLGRALDAADARPGAAPVAVLNHRTWTTRFGADPTMLGRTITLDDAPRTIVGIMPPRFEWNVADLWAPHQLNRTAADADTTVRWFQARLHRGVTIEAAAAQLNVIARRRAVERPQDYPPRFHIEVITVIDWVVGQFRSVLYMLFAAVGLLLLIACCNVANMLLARASTREREMAVRAALGAGRARLIRQLLVESLILALGGAIGGCLLAYGGIAALARWLPRQAVPWETELRLDQHVLLFALGTAALATFLFGVFPAFQSARRELASGAAAGQRGGTATRRQSRMRNGLVVAEVALSVVLLLGAAVLMRSFIALTTVDLRFEPQRLLWTGVAFAREPSAEAQYRFYRQTLERLGSLPWVRSVAVTAGVPPFGGFDSPLTVPGSTVSEQVTAQLKFASERYRETIGQPLLAGRDLVANDMAAPRKVALVNQALALKFFGAVNPIGRSLSLSRLGTFKPPVVDPTFEIVGLVGDVPNRDIREPAMPEVYLPFPFRGAGALSLFLRTAGEPLAMVSALRQEVRAIDRQVALVNTDTLESMMQRFFYAEPRFVLIVLAMFATTGLVLVALGIYGVLAYTVSQQTREIAIRMAMGGERRDVLRLILGVGLRLVGVGLVIGLAASAATNRLLVSQLWRTSPHDTVALAAVVGLVTVIALAACSVPARRAMRVEPIVALRHE